MRGVLSFAEYINLLQPTLRRHLCLCIRAFHKSPPSASSNMPENQNNTNNSDVTEVLIGKWCVVLYDNDPYPGIIQDVDTKSCALVKTMHRVGANRFYWPVKDGVIWYTHESGLGLVPEPKPVTSRNMKLIDSMWKECCSCFI